jgi:hypothetical protein
MAREMRSCSRWVSESDALRVEEGTRLVAPASLKKQPAPDLANYGALLPASSGTRNRHDPRRLPVKNSALLAPVSHIEAF